MSDFDPKIIAFCCDQSGYPAADMAGTLRSTIPRNVDIVRVPCAGRIETIHLLKPLEKGADGILVFPCHDENCQFLNGNFRVKGRLAYAHQMLKKIGLERERIEFFPLATNNGPRFVEILNRKAEELRRLGPNPVKID